ncbi:MAG: glycosyltransferase family 4 protein [bacterium]|nr:glycosyltransferase family 4 protein [bacterium]
MRILYVCHQYWPFLCGSGIFFQEMGERLVREGHEVAVLTTDALHFERFVSRRGARADRTRETHNGVRIRRFRLRHPPLHERLRRRLARLPHPAAPHLFGTGFLPGMAVECLRRHRVDLVHGGLLPYGMLLHLAARIARREGIPLVYSPFMHTGEPGDDRVLRIHSDPAQIRLLAAADAVIAQTTIEAGALARLGVPAGRIEVLGMGVNPDEIAGGDGDRFRKRHRLRGKVLFAVAPKAHDKGAPHTVGALERLLAEGRDVSLVLAGPTFEQFRSFLRSVAAPARERIVLLERVEGEEKRDLYAAGDILVMPSRNESFGMVYLEAWAAGKPVIGCRAGGVPEVIEEGGDGFLVPFGDVGAIADRVRALLDDPARSRAMGARGREKTLAGCTWDARYATLRRLYERLGPPSGR